MMVVKMMAVMMIDTRPSPPTDYQKTANSVKALFLYTPSPPAKEASVHDPEVKHNVNGNSPLTYDDLCDCVSACYCVSEYEDT